MPWLEFLRHVRTRCRRKTDAAIARVRTAMVKYTRHDDIRYSFWECAARDLRAGVIAVQMLTPDTHWRIDRHSNLHTAGRGQLGLVHLRRRYLRARNRRKLDALIARIGSLVRVLTGPNGQRNTGGERLASSPAKLMSTERTYRTRPRQVAISIEDEDHFIRTVHENFPTRTTWLSWPTQLFTGSSADSRPCARSSRMAGQSGP